MSDSRFFMKYNLVAHIVVVPPFVLVRPVVAVLVLRCSPLGILWYSSWRWFPPGQQFEILVQAREFSFCFHHFGLHAVDEVP